MHRSRQTDTSHLFGRHLQELRQHVGNFGNALDVVARLLTTVFGNFTQDMNNFPLGRFQFGIQHRRFDRLRRIHGSERKAFQVLRRKYRRIALLVDSLEHTHHAPHGIQQGHRHHGCRTVMRLFVATAIKPGILVSVLDQEGFRRPHGITDKTCIARNT